MQLEGRSRVGTLGYLLIYTYIPHISYMTHTCTYMYMYIYRYKYTDMYVTSLHMYFHMHTCVVLQALLFLLDFILGALATSSADA